MKYIVIDERKDGTGDIFSVEFAELKPAIEEAGRQWGHLTAAEKEDREIFVLESVNPDPDAEDHFDGNPVWEAEDERTKKYFLDFDPSNEDEFVLKTRDGHDVIFSGSISEIVGKDADDPWQVLDDYFEEHLGIISEEWEVG